MLLSELVDAETLQVIRELAAVPNEERLRRKHEEHAQRVQRMDYEATRRAANRKAAREHRGVGLHEGNIRPVRL